ncbi:MAG TPA: sigma-70 family RNA polymerase sigma factor [Pirellulales bacterium]|jgi:RNA polymerase sigma-70 factor (ECF subfamily)|nr:sigma-70 family RNA polymerase sigma factor [Pirellulales bacterium]
MSQTIVSKRVKRSVNPGWSNESDEELLSVYRRTGNRQAFAELVHRYERELYSYLRRFLNDGVLAEDAFQGTFLQVHLKCDRFEEGRKVRPWLYTVATNQAIDVQRRNKRHRMISLDRRNNSENEDDLGTLMELLVTKETGPVARLEADERRDWVRGAVSDLPEPLLSAVTLIYYQGLKYREAAEVLDVPVGTVKSRLHTAILKLHEAWNGAHLSEEI